MREILFRGKSVDNGEWFYGTPLYLTSETNENNKFVLIVPIGCAFGCGELDVFYAVDKDTIGQFIGLTDKNGNKIFEGDIVKGEHIESSIITYGDAGFIYKKIQYLNKNWYFGGSIDDIEYGFGNGYVEIVGNIHDNPELLGE